MAMYVVRYISLLLIFSLGIRAPGITFHQSNYESFDDHLNQQARFYRPVCVIQIFVTQNKLLNIKFCIKKINLNHYFFSHRPVTTRQPGETHGTRSRPSLPFCGQNPVLFWN